VSPTGHARNATVRAADAQTPMDLSIVIPTRDRRERLVATLGVLDRQRLDGAQAEVVVVDNGSSDGTADALRARSGALAVSVVSERREGASFARNRALEHVRAPVVLLLGDDMVPAGDGLLAGHLALHRERPEPTYGVLGQVRWAEPVDAFMRWLETAGFQFSFDHIAAGPVDPAAYLYSSHASLKTQALSDAGGFDGERFPYLMEDTELGIRLRRAGFVLDYRPELLVHHHHPQTPAAYVRRMEAIGAAARRLRELYPSEAPVQITTPAAKAPLYGPAAIAGRALLAAGVRGRLRERAWTALLMAAYVRGWRSY
jgi:glycosyltransferase involved in cell wall biosynthesis